MIVTIKTNNLPQIQMTGNAQTMKINIMKSTRNDTKCIDIFC